MYIVPYHVIPIPIFVNAVYISTAAEDVERIQCRRLLLFAASPL